MRVAKAQLEIGLDTPFRNIPSSQLDEGKHGIAGLGWAGDTLVITHDDGRVQGVPGTKVIVMDFYPEDFSAGADQLAGSEGGPEPSGEASGYEPAPPPLEEPAGPLAGEQADEQGEPPDPPPTVPEENPQQPSGRRGRRGRRGQRK